MRQFGRRITERDANQLKKDLKNESKKRTSQQKKTGEKKCEGLGTGTRYMGGGGGGGGGGGEGKRRDGRMLREKRGKEVQRARSKTEKKKETQGPNTVKVEKRRGESGEGILILHVLKVSDWGPPFSGAGKEPEGPSRRWRRL